jgi:hypothetical protein
VGKINFILGTVCDKSKFEIDVVIPSARISAAATRTLGVCNTSLTAPAQKAIIQQL